MNRRASLPGAAELFRATSAPGDAASHDEAVPAHPGVGAMPNHPTRTGRRMRAVGEHAPTGRERHDEKITVYCSPEELVDLETARLTLRAEHGLAIDRGRIVREALAVVLADLDAKGETSILVQRLRSS